MCLMPNTTEIPCWLIWERHNRYNGQIRYLRAVDTSIEQRDLHLTSIQQEREHGLIEVEEKMINHLFGHSIMMAAGSVRRPLGGDYHRQTYGGGGRAAPHPCSGG